MAIAMNVNSYNVQQNSSSNQTRTAPVATAAPSQEAMPASTALDGNVDKANSAQVSQSFTNDQAAVARLAAGEPAFADDYQGSPKFTLASKAPAAPAVNLNSNFSFNGASQDFMRPQ